MRINALTIRNFRGIQDLKAEHLGNTIIIAGQNGSGKSCIFDAVRLIKTAYGGYQQNEWQHFFGEFQIQLVGGAHNLKHLFNNEKESCYIGCHFSLSDREKRYINDNIDELLEETIWQTVLPEAFQFGGYQKALFAQQFREKQPEVDARVQRERPGVLRELVKRVIPASITLSPGGHIDISDSRLLSVIFSNYRPREIGVIDYHGPQRHYGREVVQGINLSFEQQSSQNSRQHALYNYNNKYNNVKTEMAGNFIKELLAEKAGGELDDGAKSLSQTLGELFESFFPEKKFLGPQANANGALSFPVQTQNGTVHDLDELSSGEKEILYGYLRIRSSAPRESIILLDEPELHLNPRLIRGLPEFYHKHLGEALQNQIWLVTHSDALIREAIGKVGYNLFHMMPCGSDLGSTPSQLKPLSVAGDLDFVLADLVGDLAAYRPGGKGIIFEGGGDSEFDKTFVSRLFPEELRGVNLISGTNKSRVSALHDVLSKAYEHGDLKTKFYAIVDKDSDIMKSGTPVTRFQWDVYHIENYLLNANIISTVMNSLGLSQQWTEEQVDAELMEAAKKVVSDVLSHRLRVELNEKLLSSINLSFDPKVSDLSKAFTDAIARSRQKLERALADIDEDFIRAKEKDIRTNIETSLLNGSWKRDLPGREILKQFKAAHSDINYEMFRNLIFTKMVETGEKPEGVRIIIEKIRTD